MPVGASSTRDVDRPTVGARLSAMARPDDAHIAIGEDSVWTADQGDSTVTRIDPGT